MYNKYIILILLICIFYFVARNTIYNYTTIDYNNYAIVCAKYKNDVSFLEKVPIKSAVITKDIDLPNIATESSSYLHYIIKNYDNLPDNIIFIHDHNESVHHIGKFTDNIDAWINAYQKNGFTYYEFSSYDITKEIVKTKFRETPEFYNIFKIYWDSVLQKSIGDYDAAEPNNGKCCAQFIVSRDTIRNRPIEFYQNMYDWLMNNTSGTGLGDPIDPYSGYNTGRYAEYSWRFIFNPDL